MLLAVGAGDDLHASPRTPALLLALADGGTSSALFDALSRALQERTDLQLELPEDKRLFSSCEGRERFGCFARATPEKYAYLFVITAQVDRASAMMLDLDRARAHLRSGGADRENRIFEDAVLLSSGRVTLDDAGELQRFAIDFLDRGVRPRLAGSGHWAVFGEVIARAPRPGLSISMNGTRLGESAEGSTRIRDVRTGTHTFALEELGVSKQLAVRAGTTAELVFDPPRGPSSIRTAALWGGVALAGIGLTVEVIALAAGSSSTRLDVCRGAACEVDAPARFTRAGPFLTAPLGYALFGAGGVFAGGALLSAEEDPPWIALAAGSALGVLAYGVSAALEGSR